MELLIVIYGTLAVIAFLIWLFLGTRAGERWMNNL